MNRGLRALLGFVLGALAAGALAFVVVHLIYGRYSRSTQVAYLAVGAMFMVTGSLAGLAFGASDEQRFLPQVEWTPWLKRKVLLKGLAGALLLGAYFFAQATSRGQNAWLFGGLGAAVGFLFFPVADLASGIKDPTTTPRGPRQGPPQRYGGGDEVDLS